MHKGDILGLWHMCNPPARDLSLGKCQGESGSHELGGGTWVSPYSEVQPTQMYTGALKAQLEKSGLPRQGMAAWDGPESWLLEEPGTSSGSQSQKEQTVAQLKHPSHSGS